MGRNFKISKRIWLAPDAITVTSIIKNLSLASACRQGLNKCMHPRFEYKEVQIGPIIKFSDGCWNKEGGFWELPYREAVSLGLDNRIMND